PGEQARCPSVELKHAGIAITYVATETQRAQRFSSERDPLWALCLCAMSGGSMVRKSIVLALVTLWAGTASAQDARAVLQASLKAMGGENLKTITYSGAGWSSRIGQTYGLAEDWPKDEVVKYTRVVDYDAKWSREDFARRQANSPTLGGAPMAQQHMTQILSGTYAWDMNGETVTPLPRPYMDGVAYGDLRQLELAL